MMSTRLLICDKQSAPRLFHRDVSTTTIYMHVLNCGGTGVHIPADQLGIEYDRL